ncbi:MAG: V-type ATPase subunit [Candidatus Brocadiaceae bacterium]|jgi:vacuolar-type H+-ATPase subunit C/Vma6
MNTTSPAEVRVRGLSAVAFDFLEAKLRGRRSRLREGPRLRQLTGVGTVGDLAAELFPREDIHDSVALERRLAESCVEELAYLLAYLTHRYQHLQRALVDRFAVENLKVLLRLLGRENGREEAERLLVPLPPELALPVDEMLASAGPEEFIRRIPLPGPRHSALAALPAHEEDGRVAFLEMALDAGYWGAVGEALEGLNRTERRACSAPIVCEFDAVRLVAVLRAARTYEIEWEALGAVLPVGWGSLSPAELRRVHAHPEPEALWESVSLLRRALDSPGEAEPIGQIEDALWQEGVRRANRQYYAPAPAPAVLVSYFYLKRHELRRLISLTQAIRRGMDARDIRSYLAL